MSRIVAWRSGSDLPWLEDVRAGELVIPSLVFKGTGTEPLTANAYSPHVLYLPVQSGRSSPCSDNNSPGVYSNNPPNPAATPADTADPRDVTNLPGQACFRIDPVPFVAPYDGKLSFAGGSSADYDARFEFGRNLSRRDVDRFVPTLSFYNVTTGVRIPRGAHSFGSMAGSPVVLAQGGVSRAFSVSSGQMYPLGFFAQGTATRQAGTVDLIFYLVL